MGVNENSVFGNSCRSIALGTNDAVSKMAVGGVTEAVNHPPGLSGSECGDSRRRGFSRNAAGCSHYESERPASCIAAIQNLATRHCFKCHWFLNQANPLRYFAFLSADVSSLGEAAY